MNKEDLYNAISDTRPEYLDEAYNYKPAGKGSSGVAGETECADSISETQDNNEYQIEAESFPKKNYVIRAVSAAAAVLVIAGIAGFTSELRKNENNSYIDVSQTQITVITTDFTATDNTNKVSEISTGTSAETSISAIVSVTTSKQETAVVTVTGKAEENNQEFQAAEPEYQPPVTEPENSPANTEPDNQPPVTEAIQTTYAIAVNADDYERKIVASVLPDAAETGPYRLYQYGDGTQYVEYENLMEILLKNAYELPERYFGNIQNEEDLIAKVRKFYVENMGLEYVEYMERDYAVIDGEKIHLDRQYPLYEVNYTEEFDTWYINIMPPSGKLENGTGVAIPDYTGPYMLIQGSDGKIIATAFRIKK